MDAAEICGDKWKVARVVVERTALDNIFGVVTLLIFTPAITRVYYQKDKSPWVLCIPTNSLIIERVSEEEVESRVSGRFY